MSSGTLCQCLPSDSPEGRLEGRIVTAENDLIRLTLIECIKFQMLEAKNRSTEPSAALYFQMSSWGIYLPLLYAGLRS